jgi:hypothetical protein
MKAKLTGRQVVAAIFAGIFGHLLFGGGWTLLGLVLFGGVLTGILGLTAGGLAALFGTIPRSRTSSTARAESSAACSSV